MGIRMVNAEDYPCKPEKDYPAGSYRPELKDLNYLIKFKMGKHEFAMPYGYSISRSTPESVNCYPNAKGFAFMFWMPDLRFTLENQSFKPGWRPIEKDHPNPGPEDYKVQILKAKIMTDEDGPPPSMQFKNILGARKNGYQLKPVYDGLMHVIPINETSAFDAYGNFENGRDETLINCTEPNKDGSPTLCFFDIFYRDLSISVHGGMPSDRIMDWRLITNGIRTLLEQWIVNTKK